MTLNEILKVCNGTLLCGDHNIEINSFSTDTRNIKKNSCFIGLKGDKYDGSTFCCDAIKNGASACIVDRDTDIKQKGKFAIIKVNDTLDALKKIAKYKRDKYDIPVIAITGSNGKTTTKDLIANTLSKKYKVLKTSDNQNNVIGLSKTILNLDKENMLVLEMGMNHKHEIEELSFIASPNIAVINNIGLSHIGNLGSKKNILKAKLEILKHLKKDGTAIINNDDELLNKWAYNNKKYNVITYGIEKKSNYNIKKLEKGKYISFEIENNKFKFKQLNEIYLYSILPAYITAKLFGINTNDISSSFENFKLPNGRTQIIKRNNITIISDCYNASFDSMKSSIKYLSTFKTRKIAVLGDMLELGRYSKKYHKLLAKELLQNDIDILITVGNYSKYISNNFKKSFHYENIFDAIKKINEIKRKGDVILVKASHKMNFNEIVRGINEKN